MMQKNFLLGKGERLTEDIEISSSGAPKKHPYTFGEAHERLMPMLAQSVSEINKLPADACPQDHAILSLTLHPEYLAKSYFPSRLLNEIGMTVAGSRPRMLTPVKLSRKRKTREIITTELFTLTSRSTIRAWNNNFPKWNEFNYGAKDLIAIEEITIPKPLEKIKSTLSDSGIHPLEIVLYASEIQAKNRVLKEFANFLRLRGIPNEIGRRFFAKGMCFLEIEAPMERIEEIATFSIVRAVRPMPKLRILNPVMRSNNMQKTIPQIPDEPPISNSVRVAIFDCGIPNNHPISKWVDLYEFPGMESASRELESHGVAVTSAALFGHINPKQEIRRPYSFIDHYRVVDNDPNQNPLQLYEVLERIEGVLLANSYDFVNLSIGPHLPIEDDEVHAWTAVLDNILARNTTLTTIAVGNDGESDSLLGLNRVQVPSDCVNALAIGACDSPSVIWQHAPYSSVGPGRSPGLVKPDLVDFGGVDNVPFFALSSELTPKLTADCGTSLAAPSVLRVATGVRAHLGGNLSVLAIRALLIHTAEKGDHHETKHVGWGRVARNLDEIILCDDNTVRVVYQGEISPAKYVRARIPFPSETIDGKIRIKATICFNSQIDPHHPGNYTQAGLGAIFRPHDNRFSRNKQKHPDTRSFFRKSKTGITEYELRRDASKWENCLHSSINMIGTSIQNPCFDLHYNSRNEGHNFVHDQKLTYALVVSIYAESIADLYNRIASQYATLLEPLRPILEIPIHT